MTAELTDHDTTASYPSQDGFAYRFDWGLDGLEQLAPSCEAVVIVDVLRFTTAVSAAVEAGARVRPQGWPAPDDRDTVFDGLSPIALAAAEPGTTIDVWSPNGSRLSARAIELGVPVVLAGCLRNATATARRAALLTDGAPIGVIAAGERWPGDRLRPAVEDLLGAGAVLAALDPAASISRPRCSPEAAAARAAFVAARPLLRDEIAASASARELSRWDRTAEVEMAAQLDVTTRVAQLIDGLFVSA